MIVRKLWPRESERLREHLLRLDPEDRRMRFCRPVANGFIRRYCDQIDHSRTTVVGCFVGGVLRGVAEIVAIPESTPASAEIALSVERPFQGQGIGGRLLRKALLFARNRFVDTVHLVCLSENARMRRLARRCGTAVEAGHSDGAGHSGEEGRIRLPWPSYLTLLEEAADEGQALVGMVFEVPAGELAGQLAEGDGRAG